MLRFHLVLPLSVDSLPGYVWALYQDWAVRMPGSRWEGASPQDRLRPLQQGQEDMQQSAPTVGKAYL
jgi:hypothetical protein